MSDFTRHTAHRVAEDPIAARLKAFDRADLPGPEATFDDIRRGGDRRTARKRAVVGGTALAAIVLAGALATAQLGGNQATGLTPAQTPGVESEAPVTTPTSPAETATVPGPQDTATEPVESVTTVGSTTPPQTEGTDQTRQVDLGVATVRVPADWSVEQTETGFIMDDPPPAPERFCLRDPDVDSLWCTIEIQVGQQVVGREGRVWESHQDAGWYHSTDMQPCPAQPSADSTADMSAGYGVDFAAGTAPQQGFGPVGDRTAELSTYSTRCNGGETFSPRIWWLPQTGLFIADILGNPHTEDILDSVEFTG